MFFGKILSCNIHIRIQDGKEEVCVYALYI